MNASPSASAIPRLRIESLNLGSAQALRMGGRSVLSAIGKRSVQGAVPLGRLGLAGDEQADLNVHGGLEKAVYAYPVEHYAFWQAARRRQHGAPYRSGFPQARRAV